jgi:hypothetical protein
MSLPTSFPAWVQLPDGRSAMVVDRNGYNAAVQAGASHSATTPTNNAPTPITARATSGQRTQFIQETPLSRDEVR